MLEYKGPAVSVPPLAFQSAEYLLPPGSGRRDGLSSPVDRVQVVKERAGLGHPPGVVTKRLDHLVLNLAKPGGNRPRPRRRLGPPIRRDGRAGRLPPGRWTAGSRPPRHAAGSRPLRRGAGGTPRSS